MWEPVPAHPEVGSTGRGRRLVSERVVAGQVLLPLLRLWPAGVTTYLRWQDYRNMQAFKRLPGISRNRRERLGHSAQNK
jgi:hypothetical protein